FAQSHRHSPLYPYTTLFRSAIACELRSGFQASRPNPYKLAIARWLASQFVLSPTFATPTYPPVGRSKLTGQPPCYGLLVRVRTRSEEHTSELQSPYDIVCRL